MVDNRDYDLDDDGLRTCAGCDQKYYDNAGQSCATCDEWFCTECYKDHLTSDEHARRAES